MHHDKLDSPLHVGIEDRLPAGQTLLYALQHLLALTGIWVFPVLLGRALNLSAAQTGGLVQACFVTTGIVTVLQSGRILRLPVVQGPTAAFFVAVLSVAHSEGMGTAFGSMAVAALIFAALSIPIGRLGIVGSFARYISPPLVFGTLLVIIGAQLAAVGPTGWFGTSAASLPASALAALVTVCAVLAAMVLGGQSLLKRGALLWGIVAGTLAYAALDRYQLPDLSQVHWIAVPTPWPFGFSVSAPVVLLMLIAFLQASAEAMGMYTLLAGWDGQSLDTRRVNRGLFTEFLGCALGAVFGGLGTTSYPENVGIIRVSGVASRRVTLVAGIVAIALGVVPKIGMLIAGLPGPVLSAASTVLFGIIAVSGLQMLGRIEWDELNMAVAAPAFIFSLGTMYLPPAVVARCPGFLQAIVTQPMLVGVVLLVVLNTVVNLWIRPRLGVQTQGVPYRGVGG